MSTSLYLKSLERSTKNGCPVAAATYAVFSSDGGTVLECEAVIESADGPYTAHLSFDEGAKGANPEEALRKLGEWMVRAGEALRKKEGFGPSVPLGEKKW